ncbi:MAG: peptidoglycan DD-metalloendopeptidase family protein [Neisseria sp.]|uniref:peptidoglycan DD-metalloendopeptidase family protein n=1 Tax=Neisseria sp. TaxID=192066 RepID=UPI0026DAD827|nr:peptidoglycan DD-metalloendopeptidase family protein [Neisseria sp.]MDO4641092.1 peptidoglycan DD-metalloendopeptidase family protein [Neisseria sp.]
MLKKTVIRTGSVAIALMLGACSWTQPAAPVVQGNSSGAAGSYGNEAGSSGASSSNPYGATPYEPSAGSASVTPGSAPYTPPPASPAPTTSSGGSYTPSYAPVDINAATHTVVRGDTVYNISKRYNITQDNLRAWNNLADNNISVGQTLRVKPAGYTAPAGGSARASAAPQPAPSAAPAPKASSPASGPAHTPTVATGGVRSVEGITWQRPTAGNVITNFTSSNKGVDIAGTAGQPVVAAADGKVVYAGSGLRGYGNLVIIQHTSTFLTAYGHNQSLSVKEGQTVKRGQTIAKMGNSDADRTKLHFEVRKDGKPANPANYVAF